MFPPAGGQGGQSHPEALGIGANPENLEGLSRPCHPFWLGCMALPGRWSGDRRPWDIYLLVSHPDRYILFTMELFQPRCTRYQNGIYLIRGVYDGRSIHGREGCRGREHWSP